MNIPKISIGVDKKREKHILNFDVSTTTNFGFVQPTMCREMIPNSKFSVKTNTIVRLAPMPVPTFGRAYLKQTHVFVPYVDVCPQFDSFIAKQPYASAGIAPYTPQSLTLFNLNRLVQWVLCKYADWSVYTDPNNTGKFEPFIYTGNESSSVLASMLSVLKTIWDDVTKYTAGMTHFGSVTTSGIKGRFLPSAGSNVRSLASDSEGVLLCGAKYVSCVNSVTASSSANFDYNNDLGSSTNYIKGNSSNTYVSLEDADFITRFVVGSNTYYITFKLKPYGKNIRTIMLGLGYAFNPHDTQSTFNLLKLFAFYKSWFNVFRPKRNISFNTTNCYKLIKTYQDPTYQGVLNLSTDSIANDFFPFFDDLAKDCYAYLPQDYFGMSVRRPQMQYYNNTINGSAGPENLEGNFVGLVTSPTQSGQDYVSIYPENTMTNPNNTLVAVDTNVTNPALMQMAIRVLKYANKNTIVGKSIHDYVKAHFGISLDDSHDLDSVYVIGSSSVDIRISDVLSQADSGDAQLGAYAGLGVGKGSSEKFTFTNKNLFGVWLTLTYVMPNSGYYQGYLLENRSKVRFDFFTPEFDALGYQLIERGEISDDYPVVNTMFNPATSLSITTGFGFVPRYSHLKVSKNICNGDLSLRGVKNSMSPYTLDRMFPYESKLSNQNVGIGLGAPSSYPVYVVDEFRRIDPTDSLGNYNRMFYYEKNDLDHFIINSIVECEAYMPAKSLSSSFDTDTSNDDVIEVSHS